MRVSICQEKIGQPKLKVRVKHIRLETMMNSLKLNVDGTVNVATKNIFYAIQLTSTHLDNPTSNRPTEVVDWSTIAFTHERLHDCAYS